MSRQASAGYAAARTSPLQRGAVEVSSWLGDELLADAVPVIAGTVTDDETADVRGTLELTVPAAAEWLPIGPRHPLGNVGQTLRVTRLMLNAAGDVTERFNLGSYLIDRATPDADLITVTGYGLGKRVEHARFTQPVTVAAGTFTSLVRYLLRGILPVTFDPALTDRATTERTWERERLAALREVLDAWPAVMDVDASGVAYIRPPYGGGDLTPAETYTEDGSTGTVVQLAADVDASGVVNAFTAATAPDNGSTPLYETVYVVTGPLAWGGPFGYRPGFYASPLLTTRDQLRATARAMLDRAQRRSATVRVELVTDGRREVGDVVRAVSDRARVDIVGRVTATRFALTGADEPSELLLAALSGTIDGAEL
jgi:hypothetical protein